jgi:hypothetical protein
LDNSINLNCLENINSPPEDEENTGFTTPQRQFSKWDYTETSAREKYRTKIRIEKNKNWFTDRKKIMSSQGLAPTRSKNGYAHQL